MFHPPVRMLAWLLGTILTGPAIAQTVPTGGTLTQDGAADARVDTAAPALHWELGPTGTQASLRGLCAVNDRVVWACGSSATVIRSENGGSSWRECGPTEYGQLEFRSIHAWSAARACIASAGTPAIILLTEDGGDTWMEVYRNDSPLAFFDALRFASVQRGLAFGDPVDGRLLIVESNDMGRTWQAIAPELVPLGLDGEAGFAASNSSLLLTASGSAWIGTGGVSRVQSRIHVRDSWQAAWTVRECPLPSSPTQGVFSIAGNGGTLVATGGDYRPEEKSLLSAAYSLDKGLTWLAAETQPRGFRSAVTALPLAMRSPGFITTGPEGSDFSHEGRTWTAFSQVGFHVLASSSTQVFAAGSSGRFGVLRSNAGR